MNLWEAWPDDLDAPRVDVTFALSVHGLGDNNGGLDATHSWGQANRRWSYKSISINKGWAPKTVFLVVAKAIGNKHLLTSIDDAITLTCATVVHMEPTMTDLVELAQWLIHTDATSR